MFSFIQQRQKNCQKLKLASIYTTLFFILSVYPAKAEILWNNWYVVTHHGTPDSYYNEIAEISGGKAKIKVNTWSKEGTKTKSDNLGATAKNTSLLEPLLFNYRTLEAGIEKVIDGSIIENGKVFSVKIKKGGKISAPLRAEMLPKLILASFFPVWIHQNYKKITGVQPKEFSAILEDQVDAQVPVVQGNVYEMIQDATAKKTNTRKLRVVFNEIVAYWYVTPQGDPVEISIPSLEKTVKKVSRDVAEKFL